MIVRNATIQESLDLSCSLAGLTEEEVIKFTMSVTGKTRDQILQDPITHESWLHVVRSQANKLELNGEIVVITEDGCDFGYTAVATYHDNKYFVMINSAVLRKGMLASGMNPYSLDDTYNILVEVLSHEMYHIKQMQDGDLVFGKEVITWKGQEYTVDPMTSHEAVMRYFELPWEIEAYKYQAESVGVPFEHFMNIAKLQVLSGVTGMDYDKISDATQKIKEMQG